MKCFFTELLVGILSSFIKNSSVELQYFVLEFFVCWTLMFFVSFGWYTFKRGYNKVDELEEEEGNSSCSTKTCFHNSFSPLQVILYTLYFLLFTLYFILYTLRQQLLLDKNMLSQLFLSGNPFGKWWHIKCKCFNWSPWSRTSALPATELQTSKSRGSQFWVVNYRDCQPYPNAQNTRGCGKLQKLKKIAPGGLEKWQRKKFPQTRFLTNWRFH